MLQLQLKGKLQLNSTLEKHSSLLGGSNSWKNAPSP